jgi:hypothetical protein
MARSQQCQLIQYRRRPMGTSDFAPSARWNPRKRFDQRPAGPMQSMEWSQQFYHLGLSTTNPPMEVYHVDVGWKPPIVQKTKDWKAIDHFLSVFSLSLGLPAPIFLRAPQGTPYTPSRARNNWHLNRFTVTPAHWRLDESQPERSGFPVESSPKKKPVWGRWRFFFVMDVCLQNTQNPRITLGLLGDWDGWDLPSRYTPLVYTAPLILDHTW